MWLLNRSGGEALQLTDIKGGVSDLAWSPDSARLVLVVSDPDPNDEPEKKEGWKRKTTPPIVIDRYAFKTDSSGYLNNLRDHLYLFDVAAKKSEALTTGVYSERQPVLVARRHADRVHQRARNGSRSHEQPRPVGRGREARRDAAAAHDVHWTG